MRIRITVHTGSRSPPRYFSPRAAAETTGPYAPVHAFHTVAPGIQQTLIPYRLSWATVRAFKLRVCHCGVARWERRTSSISRAPPRSARVRKCTSWGTEWLNIDFIPAEREKSYEVFDADLTYTATRWSLGVFGRNLGNRAYYTGGIQQPFVAGLFAANIGPPRTYGIHADYRFGGK